jgi:P-type E1-E2 ATPase
VVFLLFKHKPDAYNKDMTVQEFGAIVRRNFLSPVVLAIYALAVTLLILGELRDAYFVSVVITVNFAIGVFQEVRARIQLQKIELMSAPRAKRVKSDGEIEDVLYTELMAGDEIIITSGDELPADVKLHSSKGLEVDESMLTGESAPVDKVAGDISYAGSVVTAGQARAQVVAIGSDTRSGEMTHKLRQYKPSLTPLQKRINLAISALTYGALGFSNSN